MKTLIEGKKTLIEQSQTLIEQKEQPKDLDKYMSFINKGSDITVINSGGYSYCYSPMSVLPIKGII